MKHKMKVYIVMFWWYEDMTILGVFRKQTDAENCRTEFLKSNGHKHVAIEEADLK